jgi:hypothetical protein
MEAMIASTLAFLHGESDREEVRIVDISTILETICEDFADAGHEVKLKGQRDVPLSCRPLALKRAFINLIDNAVKYGYCATVTQLISFPAVYRCCKPPDFTACMRARRRAIVDARQWLARVVQCLQLGPRGAP